MDPKQKQNLIPDGDGLKGNFQEEGRLRIAFQLHPSPGLMYGMQ